MANYSSSSSVESSPGYRASSLSQGALNGLRLEEAAKKGDMDRVARLAVEILRLAQDGDAQGVLDVISSKNNKGAGGTGSKADDNGRKAPPKDIRFSANITAVHKSPQGIATEQAEIPFQRTV